MSRARLAAHVASRLLAVVAVMVCVGLAVRFGLARLQPAAAEAAAPGAGSQEPEAHAEAEIPRLLPQEMPSFLLFPEKGDAPGFDIEGVPRRDDLDRWMSFEDPSGDYRSVYYGGSELDAQELLRWFSVEMPRAGWIPIRSGEAGTLAYRRDQRLVVLQTSDECERSCATVVSISM